MRVEIKLCMDRLNGYSYLAGYKLIGSIMANGILKVGEITTSTGSGNITVGSGVTLNCRG